MFLHVLANGSGFQRSQSCKSAHQTALSILLAKAKHALHGRVVEGKKVPVLSRLVKRHEYCVSRKGDVLFFVFLVSDSHHVRWERGDKKTTSFGPGSTSPTFITAILEEKKSVREARPKKTGIESPVSHSPTLPIASYSLYIGECVTLYFIVLFRTTSLT